jgi:hypothetical protein
LNACEISTLNLTLASTPPDVAGRMLAHEIEQRPALVQQCVQQPGSPADLLFNSVS